MNRLAKRVSVLRWLYIAWFRHLIPLLHDLVFSDLVAAYWRMHEPTGERCARGVVNIMNRAVCHLIPFLDGRVFPPLVPFLRIGRCMNRLAKVCARYLGGHRGFSIGIEDVTPGNEVICLGFFDAPAEG